MNTHNIRVSVGMPLYKADAYLDEAVQSLLNQTHQNFEVCFSIDNNDQETVKMCKKYLKDPRFSMHIHTKHLGWLKNFEWLMKRQKGTYWFYFQQDDVLKPTYIESLLTYAEKHPEAAVTYCDIQCIGYKTNIVHQNSILGNAFEREIDIVHEHLPVVAFRGLVRRSCIQKILKHGGLRSNSVQDFCSDTVWMARIARFGELHRVPKTLYLKRYHSHNEHSKWDTFPLRMKEKAWLIHCHNLFLESLPVVKSIQQLTLLHDALYFRLLYAPVRNIYFKNHHMSFLKRRIYYIQFIGRLLIYPIVYFPQSLWYTVRSSVKN